MTVAAVLWLLTALFFKHFIVDFPLQWSYCYLNKGTYGHPGGLLHAGLHGVATFFVLLSFVSPALALTIGLGELIIHYHIDWAKMNINKKMGWGPTTHEQFWWLLGADQLLHALTYLGIALLLV
jgi:hypothetical protein